MYMRLLTFENKTELNLHKNIVSRESKVNKFSDSINHSLALSLINPIAFANAASLENL